MKLWHPLPVRLSAAELWWIAYLWTVEALCEEQAELWMRRMVSSYSRLDRLQRLMLSESPFLKAIRDDEA